jgi:hypothetical protein
MGPAHAVTAILAFLMTVQAVLGLLLPDEYRDVAWIKATWFGNDWVTLLAAIPLLVVALITARRDSVPGLVVWLGLLGYAIYNYAFYLFGAVFNAFFPLYVAALIAAAVALILALADIDVAAVAGRFRARTPVRMLGGFFVLVGAVLASVWLGTWAAYIFAGRPARVDTEAFKLVAALDLTLMVPLLISSGLLLWHRRPWGYILAPIAGIQASLYLLVLSVNSMVAIDRGLVGTPGELPMWGMFSLFFTGATLLLLTNVQRGFRPPYQQGVTPGSRCAE